MRAQVLLSLILAATARSQPAPDYIFVDGRILTVDGADSIAQAVAVANGKIVAVGANDAVRTLAPKNARVIDLHGRAVTPGLIDSHCHFQETAVLYDVDLSDPSVARISDPAGAQWFSENHRRLQPRGHDRGQIPVYWPGPVGPPPRSPRLRQAQRPRLRDLDGRPNGRIRPPDPRRLLALPRPPQSLGDARLLSAGVKLYMDGSGGARTGWMHQDWNKDYNGTDTGNPGYPTTDPEVFRRQVRLLHNAGIHVSTHAVGDRAIDWVVDTYAEALKARPTKGLRHGIIHCNCPTDHALDLMASLQKQYDAGCAPPSGPPGSYSSKTALARSKKARMPTSPSGTAIPTSSPPPI